MSSQTSVPIVSVIHYTIRVGNFFSSCYNY
uniref:Uncharacterized protein n=1 Tax=Anguilla anguilla TaxID=7936 RepID=A0A0E9S3R3_ANGAN